MFSNQRLLDKPDPLSAVGSSAWLGGVISWLKQLDLKLRLDENPNATRQERWNAHVGDWMLRRSCLETAAKACGLGDVCMSAKLTPHGEQRLGQAVAKDADVNCALKVKEGDEQSQAVTADLERMRSRVVVEGGNHSEKLCKVCLFPFEHDVCEPPNVKLTDAGTKTL